MAKRERLSRQRDWAERNRNMIVYVLSLVGLLGSLTGLALLPETVRVSAERIRSK